MPIFYQTSGGGAQGPQGFQGSGFQGYQGGSGGGGGTVNSINVEVDFGTNEQGNAEVAVSAVWATASMKLTVSPSGEATADHDPEDYVLEGVYGIPCDISDGVGFTLMAGCNDTTFGKYRFNIYGV